MASDLAELGLITFSESAAVRSPAPEGSSSGMALRPESAFSRGHVIPAKAGTYPLPPAPYRHSCVGRNPAPLRRASANSLSPYKGRGRRVRGGRGYCGRGSSSRFPLPRE